MALKLMYITNKPKIASIVQKSGIDRVFIDMEYIGKEERQRGLNTVKSHHTVEDIKKVRSVLDKTELLVRINPIHEKSDDYIGSKDEIERVIQAGADIIMLPMFKTAEEVTRFVDYVGGRARVMLLIETKESAENIDMISVIPGIDEIHIGLNDLHLAYKKKFMFELLSEGLIDDLCSKIRKNGVQYGFGGIARLGYGMLPAEKVITEHYRLGSSMAILSRAFCNAENMTDLNEIEQLFTKEVKRIREYEKTVSGYSEIEFLKNHLEVIKCVGEIVQKM